jgi:hypothetical protein
VKVGPEAVSETVDANLHLLISDSLRSLQGIYQTLATEGSRSAKLRPISLTDVTSQLFPQHLMCHPINESRVTLQGYKFFQKRVRSHLKFLDAIKITLCKSHSEGPQILCGTVQNVVACRNLAPRFSHLCVKH